MHGVPPDVPQAMPGASTRPRLLLIDPKPLTRSCLVSSIREASIGVVTDIADADEARQLAEAGACFDAVILNLGGEAFDVVTLAGTIAPLRSTLPGCVILLLTSQNDPRSIIAALRQGVRAYLTTDRSLDAMLDAIRFVCTGWTMYPGDGLAQMAAVLPKLQEIGDSGADPKTLTSRQMEVLHCLAKGMSNRRIATALRISQSTVKAHVKGIMLRLGAVNRTQAVALLRRELGSGDDEIQGQVAAPPSIAALDLEI